ncbi:MAG: hypothetical protein KGI59_02300, partial [Patescibacteria group bacterium]|nr:hypothetical protein [Patescibacteria group bacterium]
MKHFSVQRLVVILGIMTAVVGVLHLAVARADFNQQINYQGKLTGTTNMAVADGYYSMRFKLYTSVSGGSPIWTETWCDQNNCNGSGGGADNRIKITNGLFSVMLGSTTPFVGVDFNQPLYLSVEIGGSSASTTWDGEMSPRKILGAVPAAFYAGTSSVAITAETASTSTIALNALSAQTLQNLTPGQFLRSDTQNATSSAATFLNVLQSGAGKVAEFFGTASQSVLALLSGGNVGIGTSSPSAKLTISANGSDTNANVFLISSSTAAGATTTLYAVSNTGSTTAANGFNILAGCYAVNGVCLSGSGGASLSGGSPGTLAYWTSGTNVAATGSPTVGYVTATSTTATSTFAGFINVTGTNSTSTFSGNVVTSGNLSAGTTTLINLTATGLSTSTLAGGLRISSGGLTLGGFNCNTFNNNGKLTTDSNGDVICANDISGAGAGSSGGTWSTTTSNVAGELINYSNNNTDIVAIGNNSTTTAKFWFDPNAKQSFFSGNVGIGTTSPWAALSVYGSSDLGNSALAGYFNATNTNATSTLSGGLTVGTNGLVYDSYSGVTTISSLTTGNMSFDTDAGSVAWTNIPISAALSGTIESYTAEIGDTNVLTVYGESNGSGGSQNLRVGIGTTTPFATLTVTGSTTSATSNAFAVTDASSTRRFLVTDSGLVGIGTSSPYRALSVYGSSDLGTNALAGTFTATSTTGTSTFAGFLSVLGTNSTSTFQGFLSAGTTSLANLAVTGTATSTFTGGISASQFNSTGSATSTFAQGINLT